MQHRRIPAELPPFSKGGRGGILRPREIPLNPPFPKGEVEVSTAKHPQTRVRIAGTPVALLLRFSIKCRFSTHRYTVKDKH